MAAAATVANGRPSPGRRSSSRSGWPRTPFPRTCGVGCRSRLVLPWLMLCQRSAASTPRLKWPNDVLADGGKLAGILAEAVPTRGRIVVGIGVNVTLRSAEVPDVGIASLLELGVEAPDRDRLMRRLLLELGRRIAEWRQTSAGSSKLIVDYRARSATIGSRVCAMLPGGRRIVGAGTGRRRPRTVGDRRRRRVGRDLGRRRRTPPTG